MYWRPYLRRGLQTALRMWPGCGSAVPHVLVYHSVDNSGSVFSISASALRDQIRTLQKDGWRFVSMSSFLDCRASCSRTTRREVCLTFDDGMLNFHRGAMPVLAECGVPACVFVVSGLVGRSLTWMARDGARIRRMLQELMPGPERRRAEEGMSFLSEQPLMDWAALKDLVKVGVEVHSHTVTHRFLDELSAVEVKAELDDARKALQDRLGVSADAVAYPYGASSADVRGAAAAAGHRAGFVAEMGLPPEDVFEIGRVGAGGVLTPGELCFLLSPGGGRYLRLRSRWRIGRTRKQVARMAPADVTT